MKRVTFWIALLFTLAFLLPLTACGDDDDPSTSSGQANDDADDDVNDDANDDVDDDVNDDSVDDDTGDDDATDDDTGEDFVPDPMDVEYNPVFCATADPMGLGENLIGGGSITNTITVYVFDDHTCEPIENAMVIAGEIYYTDAAGFVEIPVTPSRERMTVAAYKADHIPWAYEADAAVMYFRLRPSNYDLDYALDWPGTFVADGEPMDFENPRVLTVMNLAQLLTNPLYAGIAFPGFSRKSLAHTDFENFFLPDDPYRIDIETLWGGYYFLLINNIYIPRLVLSALGIYMLIPDHKYFQFPIDASASETPLGGSMLKVELSQVLNPQTLQDLVEGFSQGEDILDALVSIIPGLLQRGISFSGAGLNAGWNGLGDPDIELKHIPDENTFTTTIENYDTEQDYLGILWAEIPNRAMTVMDLVMAADGAMDVQYQWIPDADYILTGVKTDMVSSWFAQSNFSFAFKYAEDSAAWAGGAAFDESDFPPFFNMNYTYYEPATHTVHWQIDQDSIDAILVINQPGGYCYGPCSTSFAMVPADQASYTFPDDYGWDGDDDDLTILVGIDLPDGVNVDEWNPMDFWGYDVKGMTIWMMPNIFYLLGELIYP